jgi:hypothetical protein
MVPSRPKALPDASGALLGPKAAIPLGSPDRAFDQLLHVGGPAFGVCPCDQSVQRNCEDRRQRDRDDLPLPRSRQWLSWHTV